MMPSHTPSRGCGGRQGFTGCKGQPRSKASPTPRQEHPDSELSTAERLALIDALSAVFLAPTVAAKLAALTEAAADLAHSPYALELLSDDAIYVRGLDPDQVQIAIARGWNVTARRVTPPCEQPRPYCLPTSTIQALEWLVLHARDAELLRKWMRGRSDQERIAIVEHIRKLRARAS